MGWTDGDEHDSKGCLTATLVNVILLLGIAVILSYLIL